MSTALRAAAAACVLFAAAHARADDDATQQGRAEFVRGTELVHHAQWSEALAAFEHSAKLKPHAVVTYNIAACERALGQYTRARKTLRDALAQNDASPGQLADALVTEAKAQLAQIDALLATAVVTLEPAGAAVAVDGRPLEQAPDGTLIAGMRLPGPGEPPPAAKFNLVMDPGVHVLTLSRKGYTDAVVNKTFAPGTSTALTLALDKLPSTFHVEADQPNAVVTFAGHDVGAVPVDVSRPSGLPYRVEVNKAGYLTYEANVTGSPGELINLRAKMSVKHPSVFTRWWFWTIAAVVVGGAATATYFLVRQPPPPNGGGLGWSVPLP